MKYNPILSLRIAINTWCNNRRIKRGLPDFPDTDEYANRPPGNYDKHFFTDKPGNSMSFKQDNGWWMSAWPHHGAIIIYDKSCLEWDDQGLIIRPEVGNFVGHIEGRQVNRPIKTGYFETLEPMGYGLYQSRIEMSAIPGYWSADWHWGNDEKTKDSDEIDTFETFYEDWPDINDHELSQHIHWERKKIHRQYGITSKLPINPTNDLIHELLWKKNYIEIRINGVVLFRSRIKIPSRELKWIINLCFATFVDPITKPDLHNLKKALILEDLRQNDVFMRVKWMRYYG